MQSGINGFCSKVIADFSPREGSAYPWLESGVQQSFIAKRLLQNYLVYAGTRQYEQEK